MDGLPWHLMDEILFRIDFKSLTMMRCTNRSLNSHISNDPDFESRYLIRAGSYLFHISKYGSKKLCYHNLSLYESRSRSPRIKTPSLKYRILDSCSGLLLLFLDSLCVANPLTKEFLFLDCVCPSIETIGFAVDQINRTTQTFKIVSILEEINSITTIYSFRINTGKSWRLSKTTIICESSNLDDIRMKKPVYLDGFLHWLRKDGSIVAFNPETEQAKLIPLKFPYNLRGKTLFAAGDNRLTLISATYKVIDVYTLDNDLKWVVVSKIMNNVLDKKTLYWNVEAYDGKCLVLREVSNYRRVIHRYDLRSKEWRVMGLIPHWCDQNRNYFLYTPSMSSVIGLGNKVILGCDDKCISSLNSIMSLIDENRIRR